MRRITVLFTTFIFSVSGLVSNPAQAAVPSDGTYLCTTGAPSSSTPNFTITNGVVSAGESCLGNVVIPAGVKSIENSAFAVSGLTSITLPAGLVSIGQSAFSDTEFFNSISIPASVKEIGDGAFRFAGLTSITVESANKNFTSTSGVLFNKASTTIIAYPSNKVATSYSIPETVTSIGGTAFSGANFTNVTIPSGVTSIGWCAFESTGITNINIPASVASIAEFTFDNTGSLTSITVDPANSDYSSIEGVLFNEAATTLITYPSQKDATSYSIPETVTSIGNSAFQRTILNSITIPETVTSIGSLAFSDANSLISVTIPSSVTSIEYGVFYAATSLTRVTIPSSVTNIGDDAFRYTALSGVYFLGDAPATGSSTPFGDIPAGAKAYIKSGASGFGNLGSIWNGLVVEEFTDIPTQIPIPAESNEVEPSTASGEGNSMVPLGVIGLVLLVLLAGFFALRRRK